MDASWWLRSILIFGCIGVPRAAPIVDNFMIVKDAHDRNGLVHATERVGGEDVAIQFTVRANIWSFVPRYIGIDEITELE